MHMNILCNDRCSMVLFASRRSQHCILTGPQHTYMQNVSLHGQPGNIDGVADFTDLFDQSHHVLIVVYMKVPWIAPRGKLHCKVSKLMQLRAHMVPDNTHGQSVIRQHIQRCPEDQIRSFELISDRRSEAAPIAQLKLFHCCQPANASCPHPEGKGEERRGNPDIKS